MPGVHTSEKALLIYEDFLKEFLEYHSDLGLYERVIRDRILNLNFKQNDIGINFFYAYYHPTEHKWDVDGINEAIEEVEKVTGNLYLKVNWKLSNFIKEKKNDSLES